MVDIVFISHTHGIFFVYWFIFWVFYFSDEIWEWEGGGETKQLEEKNHI